MGFTLARRNDKIVGPPPVLVKNRPGRRARISNYDPMTHAPLRDNALKFPLIVAISLIVLAASVSVMFAPPTASAQNTVNVIEQGVENQFPDGLRFYISAASASDIQEIRVYVQKLGQSSRSTYRHVEFEPGQTVDGEALFQSKTPGNTSLRALVFRIISRSAPPMARWLKPVLKRSFTSIPA